MNTILKSTFAAAAALVLACPLFAQTAEKYVPAPENLAAREKFQDNKFGIFLHWGVYSMLANGEWIMNNRNINYLEYAKFPAGFYPANFNAEEWVKAIKASGAKYITITSRHHDGFSMFHSKVTDYNIVDATPFKRDPLKELADACAKEGITLNFYYSHLDWHRLDYPLGNTGRNLGRPTDQQDYDSYFKFMNDQLTELLTNYGPIGCIWFDGWWDHKNDATPFDWRLREQYDHIHKLQPACMIIDNHHMPPFEGEDGQAFECDLPGENTTGFSGDSKIGQLPLETCMTMNGIWGYNATDANYKSTKDLIQYLANVAGRNANLLLNIGPQPDGSLPETAVQRLKEMGEWMDKYGETIYGTRGGWIAPHNWGVSTQKGDKLYVHIFKLQDKELFLPTGDHKIKSATVFKDGTPIKFTKCNDGILLTLPEVPTDIDYVITLTEGK